MHEGAATGAGASSFPQQRHAPYPTAAPPPRHQPSRPDGLSMTTQTFRLGSWCDDSKHLRPCPCQACNPALFLPRRTPAELAWPPPGLLLTPCTASTVSGRPSARSTPSAMWPSASMVAAFSLPGTTSSSTCAPQMGHRCVPKASTYGAGCRKGHRTQAVARPQRVVCIHSRARPVASLPGHTHTRTCVHTQTQTHAHVRTHMHMQPQAHLSGPAVLRYSQRVIARQGRGQKGEAQLWSPGDAHCLCAQAWSRRRAAPTAAAWMWSACRGPKG